MPVTKQEVETAIKEAFPGAKIELNDQEGRVTGSIWWKDFKGKDATTRNREITERVRDKLGLRAAYVGILYPLAPGENI